jgi:hypothetical protein
MHLDREDQSLSQQIHSTLCYKSSSQLSGTSVVSTAWGAGAGVGAGDVDVTGGVTALLFGLNARIGVVLLHDEVDALAGAAGFATTEVHPRPLPTPGLGVAAGGVALGRTSVPSLPRLLLPAPPEEAPAIVADSKGAGIRVSSRRIS